MSKPTRRQGSAVYYARRAIPKELRKAYGRREIWKSLGTTDCQAAKPLERLQQTAWDEEFSAAKAKLKSPVSMGEPHHLQMSPAERAERERRREEWERENEEYWEANPLPDWDDLTPEEQRIRDVAEEVRGRLEQQQREEREFLRQERLAQAAAAKSGVNSPEVRGTHLSAVVDRWAKNQKNQKTIDRMMQVVAWFEDDMGRVPLEKITAETVLNWSEKLGAFARC